MFTVRMQIARETPGAGLYQEVDATGNVIGDNRKIGTMYFRKAAFGGTLPQYLNLTVEIEGAKTAPKAAPPRRRTAA
jgi:hypothetical protein